MDTKPLKFLLDNLEDSDSLIIAYGKNRLPYLMQVGDLKKVFGTAVEAATVLELTQGVETDVRVIAPDVFKDSVETLAGSASVVSYDSSATSCSTADNVQDIIDELGNHETLITYYEVVGGASSPNTVNVPAEGTIVLDKFGSSKDAILSEVDGNNNPTWVTPKTTSGTPVTTSLDIAGNYVFSGLPTATNVSIIYVFKIKNFCRGNVDIDFIIDETALLPENTNIYAENSGLIDGAFMTVNGGDNTRFDITEGNGHILDFKTSPNSPTKIIVTIPSDTAVVVTNIGTQSQTYILVDNAGSLVQQGIPPTSSQLRTHIYLGKINHALGFIASIVNAPSLATVNSGVEDLMLEAIGVINATPIVIVPGGANLNIDHNAGILWQLGVNFNVDKNTPHSLSVSAFDSSVTPFNYVTSDLQIGAPTNNIIPGSYESPLGTITPVGSNDWSNQRIYITLTGNVLAMYGQTTYNSKALAIEGLQSETHVLPSILTNGEAILVSIITVRENATDLSVSTQAIISQASKFGEFAKGGVFTGGDMFTSTYDPGGVSSNIFDIDNYSDGSVNKFLTSDQNDALDGANTPDAGNPVATINDLKPTFNVDLDSAEAAVTRVVAGGRTTFTVTHSLNTLDLKPEVFRLSNGRTVGWRVERTGVNTVEVSRNGNVANGLFRMVI